MSERTFDEQLTKHLTDVHSIEEQAIAQLRLAERWDAAVDASLRTKGSEDVGKDVVKYLRDAHALEAQALQLLESGPGIAGFEALAQVFREPLAEPREHHRLLDQRLLRL